MIIDYIMADITTKTKKNTILILLDQLITLQKLPPSIINRLKGFEWLKKNGISFKNIRNCRQMCSPSRATIFTSSINHGLQDNIDQKYQYTTIPQVNNNKETIAKSLKKNNINLCAYYGKDHFQSSEAYVESNFSFPKVNINSNGTFNQYGFDVNNLFGDSFYFSGKGYFSDNLYFENTINHNIQNPDYIDIDGNKYTGALPFLKSRLIDGQSFHLQLHLTNPHDTQEFWDNLSQVPTSARLQFWTPFLQNQTIYKGINNPYIYNENFTNAFPTDPCLVTNYFEDSYDSYKTNSSSLPNLNSFLNDYVSNPIINSVDATLVSFQQMYEKVFTLANNQNDVQSWKNLSNNYFGLLILTDLYLYKLITFLEETDLLKTTCIMVTSDHGEQLCAHGLKQKYVHFEESQRTDIYLYSPLIDSNYIGKVSNILGNSLDINPTIEKLANIHNPSDQFLGKSLLVENKNNPGYLIPRSNDINSFNTCQCTMMASSYLYFNQWYEKQNDNIKNSVVNYPYSFSDFKYMYNSSTIILDKKQYKYTMYYNFAALIEYNLLNKPELLNNGSSISCNISEFYNFLNNKEQKEYYVLFEKLLNTIFKNYNISFTLLEIFVKTRNIQKELKRDDTLTSLIYLIFSKILMTLCKNIIYFPGSLGESYSELKSKPEYYYFYINDLINDPNEINNLADPNKGSQNDNYIPIFTKLNKIHQDLIVEFKCKNFYFIPPEIVWKSLLYYFINNNIDKIELLNNDNNLFFIVSFLSNNNFDTSSTFYKEQNKIYIELNNKS